MLQWSLSTLSIEFRSASNALAKVQIDHSILQSLLRLYYKQILLSCHLGTYACMTTGIVEQKHSSHFIEKIVCFDP